MAEKNLTAIDLFAGCGGLTEGLRQGGFNVVGAIELDPLAARTFRANHRRVHVWDQDIRLVSSPSLMRQLELRRGQLDLLAGCPPCQGFSSMRTKNGHLRIEDERNDLIHEFLRFVRDLLPKTVMMENVPGLMNDDRFFKFVDTLKKLGYDHLHYAIHNARHYGVPQRRRRLILMAGRLGPFTLPEKAKRQKTVFEAIGELPKPGRSGDPVHDMSEIRTPKIRELISLIPKNGGSRTDLPTGRQLDCHQRCDGFKDVYGRMAWEDVAPTITGGCFNPSKGRFLHPVEDRCITMREAALLQSFPRNYHFPDVSSKQDVALLIGNALPPEMIKRFAGSLRKSLWTKGNGRRKTAC
jgi:DNA (cytosine-5)-methyltransferase 1